MAFARKGTGARIFRSLRRARGIRYRGDRLRIISLAVEVPENLLDNDAMLRLIGDRAAARGVGEQDREELKSRIAGMFDRAGSRERHFDGNPRRGAAIDMVRRASQRALADAGREAEDVDLLIYCSVSRGWLEPSSAAAVQAAIGAHNASCFDVLEACAGWMRAVEIGDSLMRTGRYRNALVVGVEEGLQDAIMPASLEAGGSEHHLAGYTVGAAASAMLLEADPLLPVEIEIRSRGELHDLCMIPLPGVGAFLPDDGRELPIVGRFLSHSERLFAKVGRALVQMMRVRLTKADRDELALFILHAASANAGESLRKLLHIPENKWLCAHAEFGNTVAMSMPVALDLAIKTGRVKRGDRICFLVASAGISFGYGMLTY